MKADEKANANSTNSNKPPSSDPPGTRPGKTPTGNMRGAQVGHAPHRRPPVDPDKVSKRTASSWHDDPIWFPHESAWTWLNGRTVAGFPAGQTAHVLALEHFWTSTVLGRFDKLE